MNIKRIVFAIEDMINTLSRYAVPAGYVDYFDLRRTNRIWSCTPDSEALCD